MGMRGRGRNRALRCLRASVATVSASSATPHADGPYQWGWHAIQLNKRSGRRTGCGQRAPVQNLKGNAWNGSNGAHFRGQCSKEANISYWWQFCYKNFQPQANRCRGREDKQRVREAPYCFQLLPDLGLRGHLMLLAGLPTLVLGGLWTECLPPSGRSNRRRSFGWPLMVLNFTHIRVLFLIFYCLYIFLFKCSFLYLYFKFSCVYIFYI